MFKYGKFTFFACVSILYILPRSMIFSIWTLLLFDNNFSSHSVLKKVGIFTGTFLEQNTSGTIQSASTMLPGQSLAHKSKFLPHAY
jgi:hypothetical protein